MKPQTNHNDADRRLPIKTLPIVERWTCSSCGQCCYGNVVPLDEHDLQRLRDQHWERHPDFQQVKVIAKSGVLRPKYQLAQRPSGACVFLGDDGLCRIHKEFGFDAKPLVCRMYPRQLVPAGKTAWLTLRRSCPTAAAEHGEAMPSHLDAARAFAKQRPTLARAAPPPAIAKRAKPSWQQALIVIGAIGRLMGDHRFPLVRRLVHGLRFCELLEQCRLKTLDAGALQELAGVLVDAVPSEAGNFFHDRPPPSAAAAVLMRQFVAESLQLHPSYILRPNWSGRWRRTLAALAFARGRGEVPRLHPDFPRRSFEAVEQRTLGHLDPALQQPLNRYFESMAASAQYAVVHRPGWSLVEKFRALALAYPAAMWMLRYFGDDATPKIETMIEIITSIDRGHGYAPMTGRQHRRRIANLQQLGQIERLVVWYAR